MLFGDGSTDAITINDFLKQGLLGAVLAVFAWAVWQIVKWSRDHIATPVVESHLSLLKTLREAIPKQTETLDRQTQCLERLDEKSTVSLRLQEEQKVQLTEHHNLAVSLAKKLDAKQ